MATFKKATETLSTEELLKALEKTENNEVVEVGLQLETPVLDFIQKFGFEPGDNRVTTRLIYDTFNKIYPKLLHKKEFAAEFRKFFDHNDGFYYLNKDAEFIYTKILKIESQKTNILSSETTQRHYAAFMKHVGVEKGPFKIPTTVLYHIYRSYCIDNKRKPLSLHVFSRFSDYNIGRKRGAECNFYMVNESTAKLIPTKEHDGIKKIYTRRKTKKEKNKKKPV